MYMPGFSEAMRSREAAAHFQAGFLSSLRTSQHFHGFAKNFALCGFNVVFIEIGAGGADDAEAMIGIPREMGTADSTRGWCIKRSASEREMFPVGLSRW